MCSSDLIDELMTASKTGELKEAFGTGTAAVISPVSELYYKGDTATLNNGKIGPLTQKVYDTLIGIQRGDVADPHGWVARV